MKLDGEFVFDASVQDVWDALFDPKVLAAVLPGCEKLDLVEGQYVGDIKVKVGPIQGKFTGKVDLLDKVEPKSYRMKIDGRGAQGFVNATANIELAPDGEGTRIKYTSESNIGGKIASVGSRLVETSAKAIVKQSLEGLNENIKLRVAAYREHAAKIAADAKPAIEQTLAPAQPELKPTTSTPEATKPQPEATTPESEATTPESEATKPAPEATTPEPEATKPEPNPSEPVVQYKQADVSKLGAAVAKEVGKSLAPYLLLGALVIGVVVFLLLR
jgi:carbon monoxide dehydrogenase subunit G